MRRSFIEVVNDTKNDYYSFLNHLRNRDKTQFLRGDLLEIYREFRENENNENDELQELINYIQEAFVLGNNVYLDTRVKIGISIFILSHLEEVYTEEVSPLQFLVARERLVEPEADNNILSLNFRPFYDKAPLVRDVKSIGHGFEYLNRYLSTQMFTDTDKWKELLFDFIKDRRYKSEKLLLNDRITDTATLNDNIDTALNKLAELPPEEPYEDMKHMLQELGFERGLGKNNERITKTLNLLDNLLNSPDHVSLTEFIARIPMIFNIALVSSHGYFAQEGVLGKPDTGGQVVYILDQVRALEKELHEQLHNAGLDVKPKIIILTRLIPNAEGTTCNQRLEKVYNTDNVWILRVPFRNHNPEVTDNWISRFEIYPYLEEFAEDSAPQLTAEFGGDPDFIIGNYTDGNVVAYLLSKKFGITQGAIAHALEKNKYLYSALYWKELEDEYNFSLQFTSDLIAMNSADFVITSTFQEIAGTDKTMGQYESYKHFTMPGLYRVENGMNPYHTKFNIVSPGVNENIFFPYTEHEKRIKEVQKHLNELLFENKEDDEVAGYLEDPEKIPIFTMARLDKNKNLPALARWFGKSEEMQKYANIIIVAGKVSEEASNDREERDQIRLMHRYMDEYNLHNKMRWIGKLFRKDESGELYRIIADHGGIFVQPGLFEGFGLTVLEAMVSGLPTFATKYGGPLEIINNKRNGFHLDTVNDKETIEIINDFLKKVDDNFDEWHKLSRAGIARVNEKYNWKLHTEKLLSLAKIYGFWKYSTNFETLDMRAYLDVIYHYLYKQRAHDLLMKHNNH